MENFFKKDFFKKNLILLAIIGAGVLIACAVVLTSPAFLKLAQKQVSNVSEGLLSSQEAAAKAVNFINENVLQEGVTASLIEAVEDNGLYKIKLKIGENEFDSYVTKDGKLLFPQFFELDKNIEELAEEQAEAQQEVPKRDVPDVRLFVMSHCPYGLQAQKMFLPVYDLLKDKAKMGVYFVDYIMHEKQEIDENLRQYCIQKEEKEKYSDYLKCFVQDGDFEKCLGAAKIDRTKLADCISKTDKEFKITEQYNDQSTWLNQRFPKFDVHSDLNERYGVQGSPTIVINDVAVPLNKRSPEDFKKVICQTFNSEPAECSQVLSDEATSPGFGIGTASSTGAGQCK